MVAMFVNRSGRNEQSLQRTFQRCFLPGFGSFGQTVSEEKNFKNQSIRNKNRQGWLCLLMDRDKLSNRYRGLPIDDTYQVSAYLAKRFQRRIFFRNQPIRNKNCLWRPCLLMDRDEMSNLYRGPSRRRLKCEKLTDDRRRTPSDGKSSLCLWQDELKISTGRYLNLVIGS